MHLNGYFTAAALAALMVSANTSAAPAPDALAAQIKTLEDREEIRSLLVEYGRQLDKRDFAAYSKLFARNGEWSGSLGGAKTPAGIQAMLEKSFGEMDMKNYEHSFHLMTNEQISVNGDSATVWSRWTWVVGGPDGRPTPRRAGHYDDTLTREDGHWKFQSRHVTTDAIGSADTPESMKKK